MNQKDILNWFKINRDKKIYIGQGWRISTESAPIEIKKISEFFNQKEFGLSVTGVKIQQKDLSFKIGRLSYKFTKGIK